MFLVFGVHDFRSWKLINIFNILIYFEEKKIAVKDWSRPVEEAVISL